MGRFENMSEVKNQQACGGVCQRYKAPMPAYNQSRYEIGQKRCTMCGIYVEYEGLFCPCCNFRLRTHRRSSKDKLRIRIQKDKREALAIYN